MSSTPQREPEAQEQDRQPGRESVMHPRPDFEPRYPGSGRLKGRKVLITGGDSGIGRAVAVACAREGADIAILYLEEEGDAEKTRSLVEREGRTALTIKGDVGDEAFCRRAVDEAVRQLGGIDIVIPNAAEQHEVEQLEDLTSEQLQRTFATNVFGTVYIIKAALPHLPDGGSIIITTSVTAYQGHQTLIDYSATKGALVSLTRSLSKVLVKRGIRVNAVAPGPIWTPLIPASFDAEHVAKHGKSVPLERVGQPNEVASCFVFLACEDASYMTGQVLHPNGGTLVGS
jgi:NAD(P)-dependent dehydrogenase (short-subunit alcohol dehydrogenase family)